MTEVIADLLLLLILGFSIMQGYRKGFILTLVGVFVLLLSIWGAARISDTYAPDLEEGVVSAFGWASNEAVEEAIRDEGYTSSVTDRDTLLRIVASALNSMGIVQGEADKLAEQVVEGMQEDSVSLRTSASNAFVHALCRALLFLFVFAVLALFLTIVAHFVSMLFRLPGLRLLDTIGGLAAGLVYGLLLLFAIGWGLRFTGLLIPAEVIDNTLLLRFFVENNLFAAIM